MRDPLGIMVILVVTANLAPLSRAEAQCGGSPPCVDSGDIVDGQVKTADLAAGAVSTAKLKDGAVTSPKVADNSLSETDFAVAQRLVVAKSGGDYATISAALAAITPTATSRYIIDIMPGVYAENVVLKSYVHLRGPGPDFATVEAPVPGCCYAVISGAGVNAITISGLKVRSGHYGIFLNAGSTGAVEETDVVNTKYGILVSHAGTSLLLRGNRTANNEYGIWVDAEATARIFNNLAAGNDFYDVVINSSVGPSHISFNVYDVLGDFTGGSPVGQFNVSSSGAAQPAP